ncbi:hypothetical protein Sjap_001963 [Stephania japonica]|uniref:O-fucosyltransferase family protein n=1 Tax=Stephania japonica TaxID=461633 RepID=A0AAP0KKZ0_9MAGN
MWVGMEEGKNSSGRKKKTKRGSRIISYGGGGGGGGGGSIRRCIIVSLCTIVAMIWALSLWYPLVTVVLDRGGFPLHHDHLPGPCDDDSIAGTTRNPMVVKRDPPPLPPRMDLILWTMWCTLVYSTTLLRNDLFHLLHKWSGSPCDKDPNAAAMVPIPVVVEPDPPLRPQRRYKSNGFLQVSCNGGLNQMCAGICDMVTIARYLNLTLLVPRLDKTSFWSDTSDFKDIFDLEYFINSLRDEVRIVRSLPRMRSNVCVLSMPPRSWSSEQYYLTQILPLFRKHKVIYFTKTDTRIANNGIPVELQKLRCRVNYEALRFAPHIKDTGDKLISILKSSGSFIVLHLRYEMDMLSFSGCTRGCSVTEADELTKKR